MSLLEVVGIALSGVEVTRAELRHFSPHQESSATSRNRALGGDNRASTQYNIEPATEPDDSKARRPHASSSRSREGDSSRSSVADTSFGRMHLDGCCPLCSVVLVIHSDATCCPCCGSRWRVTIDSIELLACGLHPIRACTHWATMCEAADRVLNTTAHGRARTRP
jgi:hypothetical protein